MAVAAQLDSWIDFQLISLVDTGDGSTNLSVGASHIGI
jgi:hypothetical protein